MYDFWGVGVDFPDLVVVLFDGVDDADDLASSLVQFLQIGSLLAQFGPELFVQFGRLNHCFLAQRDVIVEPDHFNEVVLLLLVLLQVLLDDLLEAVDDELFDEGRRGPFGHHELLVGLGVEVQPFHVEEGKGDVQFGAEGELLDPLLVHPLYLDDQQLAVFVHL